ncbi:MAG: CNNM domain-containing protein [Gemmatimonadota bacterium]
MSVYLLTLLLVAVVAVLTGAATALRSVSRLWLRHWAEQRLAGAATATLFLERPPQLLVAAGTGIVGTVFALGAIIGVHVGDGALATVNALLTAALLLLVVGQLIPRALAKRWPAQTLALLLPPLQLVERATAPLVALASHAVARRRPLAPAPTAQEAVEDLLREGEVEGVGAAAERAIISGVLEFGTRQVGDVMTRRADVVAVDRALPGPAAAAFVAQAQFSRVPVYEGTVDHVVGLVTSWDVIARPATPLTIVRPVAVAAPEELCQSLMRRMLRERRHLAVVQGGAGETLGIVTLKDLVEEVVGEIQDEHDEIGGDR